MQITIGIGEYAVSNRFNDSIKTYALGSCVALILFCQVRQVLGMAHIVLPDSALDQVRAEEYPGYFADTAVDELLAVMEGKAGCSRGLLQAFLYGGAYSPAMRDLFQVGRRNLAAVEIALTGYGIACRRQQTGGTWSRTVQAEVKTGKVQVEEYPFLFSRSAAVNPCLSKN